MLSTTSKKCTLTFGEARLAKIAVNDTNPFNLVGYRERDPKVCVITNNQCARQKATRGEEGKKRKKKKKKTCLWVKTPKHKRPLFH